MEDMGEMTRPLFEFWKNKNVLVTGHTGFKGVWLSLWLERLGAQVVGISLQPTEDQSKVRAAMKPRYQSELWIDIGREESIPSLKRELKQQKIEVIFHFAAQSIVSKGFELPIETFRTNILGTAHVLEAARQIATLKSIVVVTTDKVYENQNLGTRFQEIDILGGRDPYGGSKACAEIVAKVYREAYFSSETQIGISTARAGNVIGGGDFSERRLIPDFFRAWQNNQTLFVRNPNSVRPWQHVLDPLCGYLKLAESLEKSQSRLAHGYNFGPNSDSEVCVKHLIEFFSSEFQYTNIRMDLPRQFPEAVILRLDSTKAQKDLSWKPAISLTDSLRLTSQWYKQFYKDPEMIRDLTLDQINGYDYQLGF